ncbi:MAG: Lysyl-tRNA synthetase (class II) [Parcubacteria group bacterium Athens0714_26]|nr:MAG: Lysyl-tRNA synthetase (class II) [Parcubacteria group bacterium Athens1014_26]TSD03290.1 MAG: Lysyl-tRNA synthetase (class II) [Parcubacteria group bacterium Athens0714_26]
MLNEIFKERLKKRDNLAAAGCDVYPSKIKREYQIGKVLKNFFLFSLFGKKISIAGRIISFRNQGGIIFIGLKDQSGIFQAVLFKKLIKNFNILRDNLDIGDFLAVEGTLFKTKAGQKSIKAENALVAAKSLKPLPSVWYGLKDVEERFRKRYLDIILNDEVKEKILIRSKVISTLRDILLCENFLEVETPMLQPIPGGATARPFKTHHNALNTDFYLRIAPELYLKRLLVGGLEKIFEIGRNFRNEGIDRDHNPEFTMMELYWAYQDYETLMNASQKWLQELLSRLDIKNITHEGVKLNFFSKWPRLNYEDLIEKYSDKKLENLKPEEIDEIFKKSVRPHIIEPTFVVRYPKTISPLAKSCADDPNFTERFQLIAGGTELINGFSELNDPEDQRSRMEEQEKQFRAGNEESSRLDEDFLEALEYGMPPAAGLGIGIDRLVSLLTGTHTVKEIIIFPTMRPK